MPRPSVAHACALALACAVSLCALTPALAPAATYRPPKGKVFHGVTGGRLPDFESFMRQVDAHPAVFQFFAGWGGSLDYVFDSAADRTRAMIHLTTARQNGSEAITPRGIARGRGDSFLIGLNRRIAGDGRVTYFRLMAEMNGHWNPYSAYSAGGSRRGAAHSTKSFRQAWRRATLILRGGDVAAIDRRLSSLHLPRLRTAAATLPRPRVSMLWVPQTSGSPDVRGNAPRAYWPGSRYVDWVGTDFYSKFPNFAGLDRFYADRRWARKPFVFGEWALWGSDRPAFVRRLFGWVRAHRRAGMLMYNQGNHGDGPFRLSRYPRSRRELARQLQDARFAQYAPEYR